MSPNEPQTTPECARRPSSYGRRGFTGAYECFDPDSGIIVAHEMPYISLDLGQTTTALLLRAVQSRVGVATSGVALNHRTGAHYSSCVYALNMAGDSNWPNCSRGIVFDGTAPVTADRSRGYVLKDNGGGRFLSVDNDTLCTSWPPFADEVQTLIGPNEPQ